MKSFSNFLKEAATGTKGHAYQAAIAKNIAEALKKQGKLSNYSISVAKPSSTAADIEIKNNKSGDSLIIECKMSNAQSGAITWKRNSSGWSFHQTGKSKQACQQHSVLCSQIGKMLSSPLVMNRIIDLHANLLDWCPSLGFAEGNVPFKHCKEFYPVLLDKFPVKYYGAEGEPADCSGDDVLCSIADKKGKWQIPVPSNYWQILDSMMLGDHFLQVQGSGIFRVSSCTFPSWFVPSVDGKEITIGAINNINTPPKGNLELRLKPSKGMFASKAGVVLQERELVITGKNAPKVGDHIHVAGLGKGAIATAGLPMRNSVRSNLQINGRPLTYTLGGETPPSGSIMVGKITQLKKVEQTDTGSIVRCVMQHRCGTVGFEANLRIVSVAATGTLNLENPDDCDKFASMMS